MPEMREKCQHFNSGYCKYQDKCLLLHPKEECDNKCKLINCMKRHIKPCRYGTKCRHKERCAYKHKKEINTDPKTEEIVSLKKMLEELLDYKSKSEAQIKHLEEELQAVKSKKGKEKVVDKSLVSKTELLEVDFKKLKSEFELLKLCQRNQQNKKVEKKIKETSPNNLKCNICQSTFQTGTGLTVHVDLEHPIHPVNETELKCKHCVITCSDINVMKKHILREHKFKCTECPETFKEECTLTTHTNIAHTLVEA